MKPWSPCHSPQSFPSSIILPFLCHHIHAPDSLGNSSHICGSWGNCCHTGLSLPQGLSSYGSAFKTHCFELQFIPPNQTLEISCFPQRGDCAFSCWLVDFIGTLPTSLSTTCSTITYMHTFTSLVLATPTRNTSSEQVISFFSDCIWSRISFYIHIPQHWDLLQGIQWNFHLPSWPQDSGIIECHNGISKFLILKLQNSEWIPKWTSLVPGSLTTLNSRSYSHHSPHTNWAGLAMLFMIVIMGESDCFVLRDNIIYIFLNIFESPYRFKMSNFLPSNNP